MNALSSMDPRQIEQFASGESLSRGDPAALAALLTVDEDGSGVVDAVADELVVLRPDVFFRFTCRGELSESEEDAAAAVVDELCTSARFLPRFGIILDGKSVGLFRFMTLVQKTTNK